MDFRELSKMAEAEAVQTNGFEVLFCALLYRSMAS
jgi:hypothetical protein